MSPAAFVSGYSSPLPWPQADEPLVHGYTVTQVSRLAIDAVRRLRWVRAFDFDESLLAAHHAMIAHLYTTPDPPDTDSLVHIGMRGASRRRIAEMTQHGLPTSAKGDGSHFRTYWDAVTAHTRSVDEQVTEHAALHQIWHALGQDDREVLLARAASASPAEAARRLGVTANQYHHRMRQARLRFCALWHEGQTPSRTWRRDLSASDNPTRTITTRAFAATRHRANNPPAPPRSRKKDIGAIGSELLARYYDGETLLSLAAAYGVGTRTIMRRLCEAGHVP
jgi:DNA-directed RNA polymerase specialized sigma24 family protein